MCVIFDGEKREREREGKDLYILRECRQRLEAWDGYSVLASPFLHC